MSQEHPTEEELDAIFKELRLLPVPTLGPGPHTAEEGGMGLIHIKDKDGAVRASMPASVYAEILEYNEQKDPST